MTNIDDTLLGHARNEDADTQQAPEAGGETDSVIAQASSTGLITRTGSMATVDLRADSEETAVSRASKGTEGLSEVSAQRMADHLEEKLDELRGKLDEHWRDKFGQPAQNDTPDK